MAKTILIANWKNRPGSLPEAASLLKELSKKKALYKKANLFIAPPYTYFGEAAKSVKGYASLASQDLFPIEKGSYTGHISPEILKSFGVKLAILGHSERRSLGESSAQVSDKARASLKAGIIPLVCVGEEVRDSEGEHFEFLRDQVKSSLAGLKKSDAEKLVLAYEPVWAIGEKAKGAIDPADLSLTIIFIRKVLTEIFGRAAAEKVLVLYGGSVDPENAKMLMKGSGVRGFLIGRSSLSGKSLEAIALSLTSR
jgi:triosephosphate isomerase (TIM)